MWWRKGLWGCLIQEIEMAGAGASETEGKGRKEGINQ